MKKRKMFVSILFSLLIMLLAPIIVAAAGGQDAESTGGFGWLAFAVLLGAALFVWVAYKANGKIKRWIEKNRPK